MLLSGSMPSIAHYRDRHPEIDDALAYVVRAVTDGGATSRHWFERWQAESARLLRDLQAAGRVRDDVDVEQAAALLASFGFGVLGTQDLLAGYLGGDDIMADPAATAQVTSAIRKAIGNFPMIVKLSPNVASIVPFVAVPSPIGASRLSAR